MRDLGDGDGTGRFGAVCSLARVLEPDLDVKDGDDFPLALGDLDVAFDGEDLIDLRGGAGLLARDAREVLVEVVFGPIDGVFVDLCAAG